MDGSELTPAQRAAFEAGFKRGYEGRDSRGRLRATQRVTESEEIETRDGRYKRSREVERSIEYDADGNEIEGGRY